MNSQSRRPLRTAISVSAKPGMANTLSRQRNALFAASYAADTHQRADSLIENGVVKTPDRDHFKRVSEQTIERLSKDGLI